MMWVRSQSVPYLSRSLTGIFETVPIALPMETTPHKYCFDEFQLDLKRRCLLNGFRLVIDLKPKAFEVLKYLCEHPQTLVTREELIKEVWHSVKVTEDSAKECVWEIRKALGTKGHEIIKTSHGHRGWILDCEVVPECSNAQSEPRNLPEASQPSHKIDNEQKSTESLIDATQTSGGLVYDLPLNAHETSNKATLTRRRAIAQFLTETSNGTESFDQWLFHRGRALTVTFAICVAITLALSAVVFFLWPTDPKDTVRDAAKHAAKITASAAQCLIILIALLRSWRWNPMRRFGRIDYSEEEVTRAGFADIDDFEADRDSLENELGRYLKFWRWLLGSWVALYFLFAVEVIPGAKLLQILLNILNTAFIIFCFNVLNKDDEYRRNLSPSALLAIGLIIVVVMLVITTNVQTHVTKEDLQNGGTLLTGILAGVTMALYVGRLQSKFLGPNPWLLFLLYSYTAIQPLVLYIDRHPGWAVVILNFALILKVLLYLYMAWLFHSGLLLFYLSRIKRTYGPVRYQRDAFQKLLD